MVAYFGWRYRASPQGEYRVAQSFWRGSPSHMRPVVEDALERAARELNLPAPYPKLACRADSAGTLCSAVIALAPGMSAVQGNAIFTRELLALGLTPLSGTQAADGAASVRYRAGSKVVIGLEIIGAARLEPEPAVVSTPGVGTVTVKARLALIINDYGAAPDLSREFATLPGTFTAAVKSNMEGAKSWADEARRAGMEVIVNLPLEPKNFPTRDPGAGAILVDQSGREIRKLVSEAIDTLRPVTGVKTFMGGLAVEDRDVMRPVLEEIAGEKLFFLDATGSTYSTVRELAHEIRLPHYVISSLSEVDEGYENAGTIGIRFDSLVEACRAKGYAIGVIHARPGTLEALRQRLPRLAREGIVVLGLSEVMKGLALD